jgi:twinkle protein
MSEIEDLLDGVFESGRISCPSCSRERKKKNTKTLSVTVSGDEVLYQCWHCDLKGRYQRERLQVSSNVTAISVPKHSDQSMVDEYLLKRGIDPIATFGFSLVSGTRFFNGAGELDAIGFVYGDDEAIKWRSLQGKNFTQDGAARTLWGIEKLEPNAKEIIIVEGEADVLACATASIKNAVSVPNGAPQKVSNRRVDPSEDKKFGYVWEAKSEIEAADRIVLCVDNDEPGEALAEELARRIGRAKCYRVQWPNGCKDANDALIKLGAEKLRELIAEAEAMPLQGVYSADEYGDDIADLYEEGLMGGVSTGIPSVDDLMTIVPGQLSIITGLPGSGKSSFIDQIMHNLAVRENWKFAIASFENPVPIHIVKLSELYISKPFFDGPAERMTKEESQRALRWVNEHFLFLDQKDGEPATIENILDSAKQAIMRLGCRGVVIDPANFITPTRGVENEHQGISLMLSRLLAFARAHEVHIFFVAHPAKMMTGPDGETAVPKGMNISGSASFFAKADLGFTVHRRAGTVELHVWKCRFKWVGGVGMVELDYDLPTGRYTEKVLDFEEIPNGRGFTDRIEGGRRDWE